MILLVPYARDDVYLVNISSHRRIISAQENWIEIITQLSSDIRDFMMLSDVLDIVFTYCFDYVTSLLAVKRTEEIVWTEIDLQDLFLPEMFGTGEVFPFPSLEVHDIPMDCRKRRAHGMARASRFLPSVDPVLDAEELKTLAYNHLLVHNFPLSMVPGPIFSRLFPIGLVLSREILPSTIICRST